MNRGDYVSYLPHNHESPVSHQPVSREPGQVVFWDSGGDAHEGQILDTQTTDVGLSTFRRNSI